MPNENSTGNNNEFASLGLRPELVSTLSELGYEEPTPIQAETIPPLLGGRDLIGQAATGTGKTAAFGLPMLQRVAELGGKRAKPSALILVPTRELAMQVAEAMYRYGRGLDISVIAIYGGHSFGQQRRALDRGVDVVVATPGRAIDHIRRGTMNLGSISMLALDEADEMLDMGFADDLEAILSELPEERQTVFFSATLPPRIAGMTKKYLRDPLRIQIAKEPLAKGVTPNVRQVAYVMPRAKKLTALSRILDLESPDSALIFCRTRTEVDQLAQRLTAHGYRSQPMHGGISQDQRTRVIAQLREGTIDLVVATDVAARGLDIEQLSHVINFDLPATPDSYVHRIGRVGRAGREGVAITLSDPRESRLLRQFERQIKRKISIEQVPTVADLRARRVEVTRVAIEEALVGGELDAYRVVVESLAQEHDLMDVALAAVKVLQEASDSEQEDGGEDFAAMPTSGPGRGGDRGRDRGGDRGGERGGGRPQRGDNRGGPGAGMGRIYIGAGRSAGVRAGDLVGAIAGESGISGGQIGGIDIADHFSLVELPEEVIDDVLRAMKKTHIKGKKAKIRRFVER
ncbi:MAG: DEAD/DEAH box helicase [Phycisphaeraceae bacterium]